MMESWPTSVSMMSNSGRGTRYHAGGVVPRPPPRVNRALLTAEPDMTPGPWDVCVVTPVTCVFLDMSLFLWE